MYLGGCTWEIVFRTLYLEDCIWKIVSGKLFQGDLYLIDFIWEDVSGKMYFGGCIREILTLESKNVAERHRGGELTFRVYFLKYS